MILKIMIASAAAELAASVISNLPDNLAVDPEIANPETKAENLMAFRVAHIFYDGLCRALDPGNAEGWQTPAWVNADPTTGAGGPLAKLAGEALGGLAPGGSLAQLGTMLPQIMSLVKGLVPTATKPIAGNIPSPADSLGQAKS